MKLRLTKHIVALNKGYELTEIGKAALTAPIDDIDAKMLIGNLVAETDPQTKWLMINMACLLDKPNHPLVYPPSYAIPPAILEKITGPGVDVHL